jgi:hypothetical protein
MAMPAGRPPVGTTSAEKSRTAIAGAIAARAALEPDGKRSAFFRDLGLDAAPRSVTKALSARKRASVTPFGDNPADRDWIWESYGFDAAKLGLEMVVAWIPRPTGPSSRRTQSELLASLRATRGVIALLDCMDDSVVVTALTATVLEKQQLQIRLRELCPEVLWTEVRASDPRQPARGWAFLARVVAAQEGRFIGQAEDLAPANLEGER